MNLAAMSPKTSKRIGYSHAGATEVDVQMYNAKKSLKDLILSKTERNSEAMSSPVNNENTF